MPICWKPGLVFIQDNVSIHKSDVVRDWFIDYTILIINWPPYFSDLNLIEHIWFHLKKLVLKKHPEIENMGNEEKAYQALEQALIEAWDLIPDEIFLDCLKSMENRKETIIAVKGWHTKY